MKLAEPAIKLWDVLADATRGVDLPSGSSFEKFLNAPSWQIVFTILATVYALSVDYMYRFVQDGREIIFGKTSRNLILGGIVAYTFALSVYCIVRGLAISARNGKKGPRGSSLGFLLFALGRIHLLGGLLATISCFVHMGAYLFKELGFVNPESRFIDGMLWTSGVVVALGYGVNAVMALPLLFFVNGHLSSLVRLLATGLFINLVLVANILLISFPGQKWPMFIATPFVILSVLFSVSELILGFNYFTGTKESRKLEGAKSLRGKGPVVALFRRGVQPHYGFFKDTVVTRFGFFLGIPPVTAWGYVWSKTDFTSMNTVDEHLRSTFVSVMVWSCLNISVGTLIATLVMRGTIKYERFYWLSDAFAVYLPFTGAALIWLNVYRYTSYLGFVFALFFPLRLD